MKNKIAQILGRYYGDHNVEKRMIEQIMREAFLPWLKEHSNLHTVMAFEDEIERE